MPYIKKEKRLAIDEHIDKLAMLIFEPGELNYAIITLCDRMIDRAGLMNYAGLNSIIGVLESVKLEFYRRIVVPYENVKAWENGDVFHHSHLTPRPPSDLE